MVALHLISSAGYYGAENMAVTLCRALGGQGWRCIICTIDNASGPGDALADEARRAGLEVESVPCSGRFDAAAVKRIRRLAEIYDADILHTHGYKADLFGLMAARKLRARLVATCHNWPDPSLLSRLYAVLDRRVMRRFDRAIAVSESVQTLLLRAGVARACVVENGVDCSRFEHPSSRDISIRLAFKRVVGFAGRLVPEKGGQTLLHAARAVVAQRPETGFVLVGDGPCRPELEALARRLRIGSNVVFAGFRSDMPNVYAALDVFVLPSFVEAMPMCVLEAMAARVPVIATPVGGVSRAIVDGESGLLVPAGDEHALSVAILGFLDNPGLAQCLAENGQARAREHFSSEKMAAAYGAVYLHEVLSLECPRELVSEGRRTS
jgi:glycosyltransferase involved in cell wall biosynthesis